MPRLSIDVWSDIACPWCFVGKRRLEAALERFEHAPFVDVRWRAFELDPSAPRSRPVETDYVERLARKYRVAPAQAEAMIQNMVDTAAADGIEMRFDHIRPGNTFDAHRLLHLAAERGRQDALKERFLRAYLTEGEPIGEPEALVRLAGEVGIEVDEARGVLDTDLYAHEVRMDEAEAAALGIHGVPFFVLGERFGVSGAQSPETMLRVLDKAWAELPALEVFEDGAVCGPDGC
ncbi:MAG: DsbA family oxidoreductase [Sandaracinaceae bacterium]|nr:DsbA family oxidoreductase [Sandaracinaceae bacterium]